MKNKLKLMDYYYFADVEKSRSSGWMVDQPRAKAMLAVCACYVTGLINKTRERGE